MTGRVSDTVLLPTQFGFRVEGTLVVFTIDDTDIHMDHVTAFNVAARLNQIANKAKRLSGDHGRHINVIATLTDANADIREEQQMRDGTAAFAGRKIADS